MRNYASICAVVLSWTDVLAAQPDTSNSIAGIGANNVLVDDAGCMSFCNDTEACRNDPNHHGSYCKFWQSPAVCFGLYHTNNATNTSSNGTEPSNSTNNRSGDFCFQPNDGGCDDSRLSPVICPQQVNTTCSLLCSNTPSCINDPSTRGSYCKLDSNVCFGLYWTNSTQTEACFQPNDPNCPTTFPVSCNGEMGMTTQSPGSTESSTMSEGSSTETTTETPTETTTETSTETTTETATETTTQAP